LILQMDFLIFKMDVWFLKWGFDFPNGYFGFQNKVIDIDV